MPLSMSLSLAVAPNATGLLSATEDASSVAMDVHSPIVFRLNRLPVWRWAQASASTYLIQKLPAN